MTDRRAIMLRAHQLRRWNRGAACQKHHPSAFARWLKMAWAEAKAGTLPSFAPESIEAQRIEALRDEVLYLEAGERLRPHELARLSQIRSEMHIIERDAEELAGVDVAALITNPALAVAFRSADVVPLLQEA